MKVRFDYAAISDVGMVRKNNEDNVFVPKEKIREPKNNIYSFRGSMVSDNTLFCVCDGMGGHSAGEVASYIASQQVSKNYEKITMMVKSEKNVRKVLSKFISSVNDTIYNTTEERPEYKSMGTTMVGLYFINGGAYFFNIGDSRAYMLKKNKIVQLTSDHTDSDNKHALTRFLGMSSEYGNVYPDVADKKADIGMKRRFLLCSDGLTDMVDESMIKNILSEENDVQEAAKKLVDAAKKNGGRDNITVLIIDAKPVNKAESIVKNKFVIISVIIALLAAAGAGYFVKNRSDTSGASLNDISNDIKNAKDLSEAMTNANAYIAGAAEKVSYYQDFMASIDAADENITVKRNELTQLTEQLNTAVAEITSKVNEISYSEALRDEEKLAELKNLIESEAYKNVTIILGQCDNKVNEINSALQVYKERMAQTKEAENSAGKSRNNSSGSKKSGGSSNSGVSSERESSGNSSGGSSYSGNSSSGNSSSGSSSSSGASSGSSSSGGSQNSAAEQGSSEGSGNTSSFGGRE